MDIYDKSLDVLKALAQNKEFKIYLVGGWAVWAHNPYMKSRDIDLIVERADLWKLRNFLLGLGFRETAKVLEKAGFAMLWDTDKIEVDVYTDRLGKWPVSELIEGAVTKKIAGTPVAVVSLPKLFALKVFTAQARLGTAKGEKDMADVLALLDVGWRELDFAAIGRQIELKKVLAMLLKDYPTAARFYPLPMARYKAIKAALAGVL